MRFKLKAFTAVLLLILSSQTAFASRIKDLIDVEGVRQNQLIGYGLVVGLNGTGDSLNNIPFTRQSLQAMLERLGINTRGQTMRTANVAAVMVTANMPIFASPGTKVDVTISALGDAKSLQGGTLLGTEMLGADGEIYGLAQGPIAIAGFSAEGEAASITRGAPTAGRIAGGAVIERDASFSLAEKSSVRLSLRNPDLTTARRIATSINDFLGLPSAETVDYATINLTIPKNYDGNIVSLLSDIEQLRVTPDDLARVVIDERSGVIVMGKDVRVSTIAIAQGNLTVTINEQPQVSQPEPLSDGQTVIAPRTSIEVRDDKRKLAMLREGVTLQELVDGLNSLGLGPRDMIAILQAIKASGALQAQIEVM